MIWRLFPNLTYWPFFSWADYVFHFYDTCHNIFRHLTPNLSGNCSVFSNAGFFQFLQNVHEPLDYRQHIWIVSRTQASSSINYLCGLFANCVFVASVSDIIAKIGRFFLNEWMYESHVPPYSDGVKGGWLRSRLKLFPRTIPCNL